MEGAPSLKENGIIDQHGCPSCSKEQLFYKEYMNQDCMVKSDRKQKLQRYGLISNFTRHHHLWKWRTFVNVISARFLNCILYLVVLLLRLLHGFKNHKRTFLHSILLLYGLFLLLPLSSGEVLPSPQGDSKLRNVIVPMGTHFVYKIPYSLFDCNVDRLEISEGSTRSLPNWLAYSETRQELYGVASLKDTGQYDILIVAVTNSASGAGQICGIKAFSITVSTKDTSPQTKKDYTSSPLSSVAIEIHSSPTESSYFQCPGGSHSIFGTVLVSADMHQLTGDQRVKVLTSMASLLNVSSFKVGLYASDSGHPLLTQLDQLSVVSSGSGDGRFKPGSKSLLTWLLNCGVMRLSDSYLSKLETAAKDGVMSEALGYSVVSWHITSGVQKVKHRVRRAAAATPTPQASSTLPTRLPSSTIIISETSSLSRSSFTFSNSTATPQSSSYVSSTLSASFTSSISSLTSTPVLTSFMPSTSSQTVSSTVAVNSTISIDVTPSVTLSSSIPSTTLQPVMSTVVVNTSSAALSTSFLSSTIQPSTSVAAENTSSSLYTSSPTIQSSSLIPTTSIQGESSTVTVNDSSSINYTMPATTILPSTPTYTMNGSSYLMTSSTPLLTSSSVLASSSLVALNSSYVKYQNSSTIYSTTSIATPGNSTVFIPKSTHSVLVNTSTYLSSSSVDVSSSRSILSSSMLSNQTSSIAPSSTISPTMSSTLSVNQTSNIQPSFETSSIVLPTSTISPSMSYNVSSNITVYASSSVSVSHVESTIPVAANTSSAVSLLPSISTVPVMTTVNITSMISPTILNTSSIKGVSTVMTASSSYNVTASSVYDTATVKTTTTVMETQSQNMTSTVSMTTTSLVSSPSVSMVTTPSSSVVSSSPVRSSYSITSSVTSLPSSVLETSSRVVITTVFPSNSSIASSSIPGITSSPSSSTIKSSATSSLIPTNSSSYLSNTTLIVPTSSAISPTGSSSIPGITSSSHSSLSATPLSSFIPSRISSTMESSATTSFIQTSTLRTLSVSTMRTSPTSSLIPTSSSSYLSYNTSIVPTSAAISSTGSSHSTRYTATVVTPYSSFVSSPSVTTTYPTTGVMHSSSAVTSDVYSTTVDVRPSTSVLQSTLVTTSESPGRPSTMLPTSSYSSLATRSATTTSMSTPRMSSSTVTVAPSSTLPASASPNFTSFISSSTTSSPLPTSSIVTPTAKPNSPPVLMNDIGRIPVTAGIAFTYLVPTDTFHDTEDGDTRHLNLTLFQVVEARALPIPTNFWLTFNGVNQTINGLPMDKDIPDPENPEIGVKFLLNAKDSRGAVAYDVFEILISSSQNRAYTQSLTVTLNNNYAAFTNDVNQRLNLLNKISSYYKDPDTSQIRLLSYKEGSVVVSWVNDSLPTNECNKEKLNQIAEVVTTNNGVTVGFKEHLSPDFEATGAQRTFSGMCLQTASTSAPYITARNVATEPSDLWEKHVIPGIIVVIILIILAILLICFVMRRRRAKPSDPEKRTYTKRKPIILEPEMEMKPIPSKPLILENDSPTSYPPSYLSESSLYKSPSGYYDNQVGDFDEEDNTLPPRHSPVYETPPPSYVQPDELQEPPPPPYILPPALLYPRYELPPWEESSEV